MTLGRVYAALGRYLQARRSLRLAVALDPDLREAREELAFVDALEIDVLEREVKDERPATN